MTAVERRANTAADGRTMGAGSDRTQRSATIDSVEATAFRLRYAAPIALSDGVRESATQILVTVTTSDGVRGYAECIPRPGIYGETTRGACELIRTVLAPLAAGIGVGELRRLTTALGTIRGNPAARSAVELAAFDAFARTLGVPAYELLGGAADRVPVASILAYGTIDAVVGQASAEHRDGVRAFKAKVGQHAVRDAEIVHALRSELGPEVLLYADANGRYTVAEAERFLTLTSDDGLWGLEEPTAAEDLIGRARLARRSPIPIIADETGADPRTVAGELLAGRSTGVSIKLARTGIADSTTIREHCAALGLPVSTGTQADSAVGAYAAAAFAVASPITLRGPAELLYFTAFAEQLVRQPPTIEAGAIVLSRHAGFGFEIDPDALQECALP